MGFIHNNSLAGPLRCHPEPKSDCVWCLFYSILSGVFFSPLGVALKIQKIVAMPALRTALLTLSAASLAVASSADDLKSCLKYALTDSGQVAFAGDLLYQVNDVKPYNLNTPITPAAVTFPTSSQQVAAVVKCAAENGYPVQPKSGGHSYGNYGLS